MRYQDLCELNRLLLVLEFIQAATTRRGPPAANLVQPQKRLREDATFVERCRSLNSTPGERSSFELLELRRGMGEVLTI